MLVVSVVVMVADSVELLVSLLEVSLADESVEVLVSVADVSVEVLVSLVDAPEVLVSDVVAVALGDDVSVSVLAGVVTIVEESVADVQIC